jgi:predicted dehydrogenase
LNELRLGLVGCGRLARGWYAPALERLDGARLAAVADPAPASREWAGRRFRDAHVFESLETMLGAGAIDALLVASPPSAHLAAWRAAASAGLPAFIEKPLLLAHELEQIDRELERAPVMVDFNRRFWPPYVRAHELVASGALGRPVEVEMILHLDVRRWSEVSSHRLDPREGGLAHDLGAHALDLAAWIAGGEPVELAALATLHDRPGDTLLAGIQFADGSRVSIDVAYLQRTREVLHVQGPLGSFRLVEPNLPPRITIGRPQGRDLGIWLRGLPLLAARALDRSKSFSRASIAAALAAFVAAVRAGGPFTPGIDEGLTSAAWLRAALRSAARDGEAQRLL